MTEEVQGTEQQQPSEEQQAPPPNPAAAPDRPAGYVPHEALHEARESNKRIAAELGEVRARSERMEQTFQKLISSLNEKPAPDPTKDPLGHIQHRNEALESELKGIGTKLDQLQRQTSEQDRYQQIAQGIASDEQAFRSAAPDYDQAVQFLKDSRREDLRDLGVPAHQIDAILGQEVMQFAAAAAQQGKSAAKTAYDMAKRRGFKAGAKATPQQTIETIAKGQEAAKTVDGSSTQSLRLQDLANLPDAQIDAIIQDPAKWKALVRGQTIQ